MPHVILARLDGKRLAVAIVDGIPEMVKMKDWPTFCASHRGATLFGCDVSFSYQPEEVAPDECFDDPADAKWIEEELRRGNDWAWFYVVATARRGDFKAEDGMGCCSYRNEVDWMSMDGCGEMACTVATELQTRFVASFGTFETI